MNTNDSNTGAATEPPSSEHEPARGVSIRWLAPLAIALPVLVVSVVLSALALAQSRAATDDLAARIVREIDARVRDRVLQLTGLAARLSEQNEYLFERGVFDPADLRAWRSAMHEQIRVFDGLSGLCWGDRDGRATWLVDYPDADGLEFAITDDDRPGTIDLFDMTADGALEPTVRSTLDYDPRGRPWYLAGVAAAEEGTPAGWTDAYGWVRADGSTATLGISYARPIYDKNGDLLGVLDTELELQSVSKFLQSLSVGETGAAFLVDRSGLLLASSVGEALVDDDQARLAAQDAQHPLTRAAATAAASSFGPLGEIERPGRTHAPDIAGAPAWVGVSPIGTAGLRWTLVTVVPEADLTARVDELRRRSAIAAIVLVSAALALGVLLAGLAVRPIVRLRDHVRRVGSGELDRRLRLRSVRELADLSTDINTMTDALLDRAKLQESLRLAMEVQQALLPDGPPRSPGLDVAGLSEYCDETGGDYYDFLGVTETGGEALGIALGDVMGHGVAAALLMASARAMLRSRTAEASDESLADHLAHVNTQLAADTGGVRFMTMLLMVADGREGALAWSTAGQHSGLLYRPDTGDFSELPGSGLPLGIDEDAEYELHSARGIPPGSVLLITTDGLFEAANPEGEMYEWDRIRESIRRHVSLPAQALAEALHADLLAFCGERTPEDDVTFIVVKFTGAKPVR